jgi:hypothetical protein
MKCRSALRKDDGPEAFSLVVSLLARCRLIRLMSTCYYYFLCPHSPPPTVDEICFSSFIRSNKKKEYFVGIKMNFEFTCVVVVGRATKGTTVVHENFMFGIGKSFTSFPFPLPSLNFNLKIHID